jgi:hypothetical protein
MHEFNWGLPHNVVSAKCAEHHKLHMRTIVQQSLTRAAFEFFAVAIITVPDCVVESGANWRVWLREKMPQENRMKRNN